MLRIRLSRKGRAHNAFFHVVVAEKSSPRDGRYCEKIGYYDPKKKIKDKINKERFDYWSSVGAQASQTVKRIVKKLYG